MTELINERKKNILMINSIFSTSKIEFEKTSELQRQILASFAFGMVYAEGKIKRISPPEIHSLVIAMLQDCFNYSSEQAGSFSRLLIDAASDKSVNKVINSVVHRGVDGHQQWQNGKTEELRSNIEEIMTNINGA